RADVGDRLQRLAEGQARCADGARLAFLICESERLTGAVDMTWVDRQERAQTALEVNSWFDSLPDLPMRSLAIALALLNGLSFETVTFAASRLRRRLEEPLIGRTTDPDIRLVTSLPQRADPFRDTRAARLLRLRATITETVLPAWFGNTPTQVMSFADPDYAPAVLNRVW